MELRDARRAVEHFTRASRIAPDDSVARARATWSRESLAIRDDRVAVPPEQLTGLVGDYGMLKVSLENGRPYNIDESGNKTRLIALAGGRFAVSGLPIVRVSFAYDPSGRVERMVRHLRDGDRFEDARTSR